MRSGLRYSILALVATLVLCFGALSWAQIKFEDFSDVNYANAHLVQNTVQSPGGLPHLATYQGNSVLRLTDGGLNNPEASSVYFNVTQPLTNGFYTYFAFQIHNPTGCCNPGDGIAFIIQNSNATDGSQGASGSGITALGAGGATNQAGAMGYSGINNSLVVEFDISQNDWDPNSNHVAIQSCGKSYNSPVHLPGDYTIGGNDEVTSCLYSEQSINLSVPMIAGVCMPPNVCRDGPVHQVAIQYVAPPGKGSQGTLNIWLDPPFLLGTHDVVPGTPTTISVPLTIDAQLALNTQNCLPGTPCSALAGFTASQTGSGVAQGTVQDIFAWEFTSVQITQVIKQGGLPTVFGFGVHDMVVTYPLGFQNPNGILMTVAATSVDRSDFYQQRLLGTDFANEQCIVYSNTGGKLKPNASGDCIVYTVTCQDSSGQPAQCPPEGQPTIGIVTSYDTLDQVNGQNADFLEAEPAGSNNWMSIFTGFQDRPIDGTTSGKGQGFGGLGGSHPLKIGGVGTGADIVATFCPSNPGNGSGASGCSQSRRMSQSTAGQADKAAATAPVAGQK